MGVGRFVIYGLMLGEFQDSILTTGGSRFNVALLCTLNPFHNPELITLRLDLIPELALELKTADRNCLLFIRQSPLPSS